MEEDVVPALTDITAMVVVVAGVVAGEHMPTMGMSHVTAHLNHMVMYLVTIAGN